MTEKKDQVVTSYSSESKRQIQESLHFVALTSMGQSVTMKKPERMGENATTKLALPSATQNLP
jgi:hypothetical protein